ncbi:hypothetical protein ABE07_27395 [Bacillus thuringiensis]|uniref:Uncharacterized protein n=1 Tax=Bacillus cereus TaxID=1396 RepID=A0A9X0MFX0_BACCE|nr:hypothetical protein AT268_08545 [Bacillus cereus]MBG9633132.1 hypothetical protein [Bacillus thuringiensis]MBG9647250.1 hypothetical protein [Bacillus thuringiensis]MBG9653019.1 hypothetical protein [Bacillus thuringiensis]MBG9667883.1 hypothetical protein [Bacillus thuringiensis]
MTYASYNFFHLPVFTVVLKRNLSIYSGGTVLEFHQASLLNTKRNFRVPIFLLKGI